LDNRGVSIDIRIKFFRLLRIGDLTRLSAVEVDAYQVSRPPRDLQ
jgi:hypothetical protein